VLLTIHHQSQTDSAIRLLSHYAELIGTNMDKMDSKLDQQLLQK